MHIFTLDPVFLIDLPLYLQNCDLPGDLEITGLEMISKYQLIFIIQGKGLFRIELAFPEGITAGTSGLEIEVEYSFVPYVRGNTVSKVSDPSLPNWLRVSFIEFMPEYANIFATEAIVHSERFYSV